MPDLDHVLSPAASRDREAPPYPLILEGETTTVNGEPFVRIESSAVVGPVVGADALGIGAAVVVAISQEGIPYVVYPTDAAGLPFINVKDQGAKGDGIADDTAAIQRAIDLGRTIRKAVYFPLGTYMISREVSVYAYSSLFGDGPGSVIKLVAGLTANTDMIGHKTAEVADGVVIRSLTLDGNKDAQIPALYTTCLQLLRMSNLLLENLSIRNGLIEGAYVYASDGVRIVRCNAIGNGFRRADASGFHLDSCTRSLLHGCIADTNGFHGYIFTGTTDSVIDSCWAKGNGFDGARIQYASNRNRFGRFVSDTNFRGIYFTTGSAFNAVEHSVLVNAEASGFVCNAAPSNFLLGSHVENCNYGVETVDAIDKEYGSANTFRALRTGNTSLAAGSTFTTATDPFQNL